MPRPRAPRVIAEHIGVVPGARCARPHGHSGRGERERERELGALALTARHREVAAVRLDDPPRDREAEPGATLLGAAAPVAIEHGREPGVAYSWTLVVE